METPVAEPMAPAMEGDNPAPTNAITSAATISDESPVQKPSKPVHSLVIDANAIIRNDPTVSTLIAQAQELYTIPSVVSESGLSAVEVVQTNI